jgi:hypothetical protein
MAKKWYRCSVAWTMAGGCDVEAESLEEAQQIIDKRGLAAFNGSYVEDSFVVDELEESEVQDG